MSNSVTIDARFNGPPDSANGGYTCGLLAAEIDGPAEVTLRRPPPLERELTVAHDGGRALLLEGDDLVAEAVAVTADWDVPEPVAVDEARAAQEGSPFLARPRPFVTCFVCGPDREADDPGLRIFPGPLEGRDGVHAGTWTPSASLAGRAGEAAARVPPEIVWASLDCPTSGPLANWARADGTLRPIVLARLAVDLRAPVETGREHVVVARRTAVEGRKRYSVAALFTADGELLASARALWIELKEDTTIAA